MAYTAKEAKEAIANLDLDRLSPKQIEEELKSIINQLDTTPLNTSNSAITVLYSATSVEDIADNPNFRLLNNTEAYVFLDKARENEPLIDALEKVHGERPDFGIWTSQAGIFIGGDDSIFPRDKGAWDTISANFVKGAEGNVITNIGENAGANRVFLQTELQAIRENPNITHIDGIKKNELFKELDTLETPQHQINYFKTMTYARVEIYNALKESADFELKSHLEVTRTHIQDFLDSNTPQAKEIANKIDTHQLDLFTKTEVAHATGIAYDKISDEEIKTFLSQDTDLSKRVKDKIDTHAKELSVYNPDMKNFDLSTHGKYAILGAVGASVLSTTQADASNIPTLHLNAHLDKNKDIFDTLSTNEQIGAEIGAGFNGINAVQAGEEFRTGATKSTATLLDKQAYKEGLEQATDAWKPSLTKEVATLGAMDSAKVAGKSFLKKLPLIGLGAGIAFGIGRAMDGDWKGAGMEIASGAMSLVPGWGTAGSVAMDAALLEKDTGLLTHGAQQLLSKEEEQETFVQSEDNHTTIESSPANGMVILGGDHAVSINDIERAEEEPFDSLSHAQRIIDDMSETHGWNNDYDNSNEMGMEIE